MLIVYDSKTGNVERFVRKIRFRAVKLSEVDKVEEPFVLVTYTTGFGEVPKEVDAFLKKNPDYLVGVTASGNKNWGSNFGKSADVIAAAYGVPVVSKFELSGTEADVSSFIKGVMSLETYRAEQ